LPEDSGILKIRGLNATQRPFGINWFSIFAQSCRERRLLSTIEFCYIGLRNCHMVTGDLVAIQFGMHVPCLLRPLSGKPEHDCGFIGEAYSISTVQVIGEAVQDYPEELCQG
jgi:hypothetical protein